MTPLAADRLLVTADDRTGALETAGAIADGGLGRVLVRVGGDARLGDTNAVVLDIDTRHRPADEAARSVRATHARHEVRWHAHKIDSTLRGAWASEVAALVGDRRVLLVPAFPAAGRTCRAGVVLVDGVPVHETAIGRDRRAPVRSSRPADHLRDAGLDDHDVAMLDADRVDQWLTEGTSRLGVVADVADDGALAAAVGAWCDRSGADGVLVGPAGVHGALARALASRGRSVEPVVPPAVRAPVLVVVGSAHPAARAQLDALRAAAIPGVVVCATGTPTDASTPVDPRAHLESLMAEVRDAITRTAPFALVVVGGETAAAVLGDADVLVAGTMGTGMPWGHLVSEPGRGRLVVTKPGGFGASDLLVRMLRERMG